jgi:phage tail sheath protein FI
VHWIWKVLACLLPFAVGAVLVIAALLGTHTVHTGTRLPVGAAPGRSVTPSGAANASGSGFVLPGWVPWTLLLVLIAAAALVVVVLVRRGRSSAPDSAEPDTVRTAVRAAIGALDTNDDPRHGVIAAYVAMEGTFAVNGLARTESEAPREYLERVLGAEGVVDRDARTLTGLFEQARFSPHPISARMRDLARSALAGLHSRPEGGGGP